jgi:hypothetical protein
MSGEVVLLSLDKSFNKVQYLLGLFSLRLSSSSIIFEEEQIFSELDFKITDKEIIEGIFSLKNKKSSGMDMILNEMLKSHLLYFF